MVSSPWVTSYLWNHSHVLYGPRPGLFLCNICICSNRAAILDSSEDQIGRASGSFTTECGMLCIISA